MKRLGIFSLVLAILVLFTSDLFAGGFVGFANVGGGGNVSIRQVQRGPLGFPRSVTRINSNNGGFSNVNIANVNGFGLGRNRTNINVFNNNGFGGNAAVLSLNAGLPVTTFNGFRVNSFGTRTVVDGSGNIFEVDSFGNSAFRGNAAARGFSTFNSFGAFGGVPVTNFAVPGGCGGSSLSIRSFGF